MGDLDTDPKMMRAQQGQDVPETVEADETNGVRDRSDSDPLSRAAREAAKGEVIADPADGQDDVLAANRAAAGAGSPAPKQNEEGPLANKDRSLLGR